MRDQPTGPLGPPPNGHRPNGRPTNSHPVDGHAVDGHAVNGHRANGHRTNGHTTDASPTEALHLNGAHSDGARVNGVVRQLPFTRARTLDDDADPPPDLVAVQADDELITALGARPPASPVHRRPLPGDVGPPWSEGRDGGDGGTLGDPAGPGRDDRIVRMLAAWRTEIDAEPIPELVDIDTAVATVVAAAAARNAAEQATARRRRIGRMRHLAPLAAAAAVVVATVGGVTLGSQDAMPGDTLWAIQKVVNPTRAESVEAKVEVEVRLAKMRTALRNGDKVAAARELEVIRTLTPAVLAEHGSSMLVQEEQFLAAKVADATQGKPVDLSTPPVSNPRARSTSVPPVVAGVPPSDPLTSGPGSPDPAAPDVASVPGDPGGEAAVPMPPGAISPAKPGTDSVEPGPAVTPAPNDPKPEPLPSPGPGTGNTEGGTDGNVAPAPGDPPPSSAENPPPGGVATTSGTATASGSAGEDPEPAATATT